MKLGQSIGLLALVICLYVLWQIRHVLLLVFAAVVLATALNKLARRFQRSGLRRIFAVMLSVGIFVACVVGFFWLIVPPFAAQFQELTVRVPKGLDRLNDWVEHLGTRVPSQLTPYLPNVDNLSQQVQPLINRLLGSSVAFFSSSLGVVLEILLVLVLTGMMLANPHAYRQLFVRLFPSFYRRRVDGILRECEEALGRWMGGALISMSVVALMSIIGLTFLHVPAALALGVLAGFLNLIPNLGPTISVIPPMAIALLDSPLKSLAVLALYFFIQQTESNFLTPVVMAHQVSLLPAVTLLSQVVFATFFGFLGLFLALPLTVVAKIWFREVVLEDVLDQWRSRSPEPADPKKNTYKVDDTGTTEIVIADSRNSSDPEVDDATLT